MKWSPWPCGSTKMFHVKVNQLKLQGFNSNEKQRVGVIEVKWKGSKPGVPAALVPFYGKILSQHSKNYTGHRCLINPCELIEWNDEFQSLCNFGLKQSGSFIPWNLSFTLLQGESGESKSNMMVMGKASLNLAETASKMEYQVQRKLSVTLKMKGMASTSREASLLVCLSFAEVPDSAGIVQDSAELDKDRLLRGVSYFRSFRRTNNVRKGHGDRVTTSNDWDESSAMSDSDGSPRNEVLCTGGVNVGSLTSKAELGSSPNSETRFDSEQKNWFLRKRKWLNGRPTRRKVEPLIENTSRANADGIVESSSQSHPKHGNGITSRWELREVVSREGEAKLKTNVFFASFDQRSEKAAGESACTALVAVIAHWLHSNQESMPTRPEFDSLITQGSLEWQKLCTNDTYLTFFPNKHFDLETVLEADVRPLRVSPEQSFIGFFSPDKFESLKRLMSFDEIWNEINRNTMLYNYAPRIYIASWNDHFFVLKLEADAYYIIDSLGERLFEGCNQAYILKFEKSSVMYGNAEKEEAGPQEAARFESSKEENPEVLRSGKECCKEFIKRFLAAIPLGELKEEEKKKTVSILRLHERLQIEFHHTSSSSTLSSSATSSSYSSQVKRVHKNQVAELHRRG